MSERVSCCLSQEYFCFLILVIADSSLLKSVPEYSHLIVSHWKDQHPSDMEDKVAVGLSREDEAVGWKLILVYLNEVSVVQ